MLPMVFRELEVVYIFLLLVPFHCHCQLVNSHLQQKSGGWTAAPQSHRFLWACYAWHKRPNEVISSLLFQQRKLLVVRQGALCPRVLLVSQLAFYCQPDTFCLSSVILSSQSHQHHHQQKLTIRKIFYFIFDEIHYHMGFTFFQFLVLFCFLQRIVILIFPVFLFFCLSSSDIIFGIVFHIVLFFVCLAQIYSDIYFQDYPFFYFFSF